MNVTLTDRDGSNIKVSARDLVDRRIKTETMRYYRTLAFEQGWLNDRGTVVSDPVTHEVIAQRVQIIKGASNILMDIPSPEELFDEPSREFMRKQGLSDEQINNLAAKFGL